MSLDIKTTISVDEAANFIASSIGAQLKQGKQVLWLIAGGSAITVAVKASEIIRNNPHQNLTQNLTIALTDERYGPMGHIDSNWQQLMEKGFSLPEAKLIPVLTGEDRATETEKFNVFLNQEFKIIKYKIGLFGIGADGHTSGILPESVAVDCPQLACGYDAPKFYRITTTPRAIEQLDEAIVWAQGEDKWKTIKDLQKDVSISKQPAQALKKVPLLTIFTDYQNLNG